MGSNQSYIEKADLAIADLSSGGLLVAQQVKEFFEILIENSKLLPLVTTVTMEAPSWELSKMGFTGRVLRPAIENSALPWADRSKPELGKVTLTTRELIAEARIPYAVVEDNIANGSFPQLVMQYLSKAISRDMEDIIISGSTASADPTLAVFDGALAQITSNVVNAGGVRLSKSVLKTMVQTLPRQYVGSGRYVFITSKNAAIDYVDSLSNRQTPVGDDALTKAGIADYSGYPVIQVPLMPENIGTNSNKTNVLFLDPKNIHVGLQRDVRIESGRDISARVFIVVASIRMGMKLAHEPATVKATEVLAVAG